MATHVLPDERSSTSPDRRRLERRGPRSRLARYLKPIASLKLTVALFSLALLLILAGTLAQRYTDAFGALHHYFRVWLAWIELKIFVPQSWGWSGGFYFPGGWMIGGLLGVNLIAAHAVRFKAQARGARLFAGLAVIAAGIALTWCVIVGVSPIDVSRLWTGMKCILALLLLASIYGLFKLDSSRRFEFGLLCAAVIAAAGLLAWLLFHKEFIPATSSMHILWELLEGTAAALVLLGGCTLAFKKRAAVVLIHAGIGLIMFNELYVGMTAVEGRMRIREGYASNYVEDYDATEIAVLDSSDPREDEVTVVPESVFLTDKTLRDARLPFDIRVMKFMRNSVLDGADPARSNPATAGYGLKSTVREVAAVTGMDSEEINMPAAYIQLTDKQDAHPLGAYLVGAQLSEAAPLQPVEVDGKTYGLGLRFKRTYKPYSVQLLKVQQENYAATNTPQSFSSDIHLIDPSNHTDRHAHISMNDPMRTGDETFYQSGVGGFDPSVNAPKSTTLSIVLNPRWMIPYVGCMIVVVGLLTHFLSMLVRFLRRFSAQATTGGESSATGHYRPLYETATLAAFTGPSNRSASASTLRTVSEFFPWLVVAVLVGWVASKAIPPRPAADAMNLYEFGKLPVMFEGRVKPFDTLAHALNTISETQEYVDDDGNRKPAAWWLLDLMSDRKNAAKRKIFRIENPAVQDMLGLKSRAGFRYALDEFEDRRAEMVKQVKLIGKVDKDSRTIDQKKTLELNKRWAMLLMLIDAFNPPEVPKIEHPDDPEVVKRVQDMLSEFDASMEAAEAPLAVPIQSSEGKWETYSVALLRTQLDGQGLDRQGLAPAVALKKVLDAYRQKDPERFNEEVLAYQALLAGSPPKSLDMHAVGFEVFFNYFAPFKCAAVLYLVAFLLACVALLTWSFGWSAPFSRASFWLIVATLALHTFALVGRIYISGRPPVTSLYSSAIFIGWAVVAIGIVLEIMFGLGIGNLIAGFGGYATLLIAYFLAASGGDTATGDTFAVLRAVLDTQFWLATHVTCVTLGYATTFVAGALGVLYILLGLTTPLLSLPLYQQRSSSKPYTVGKALSGAIYGVVCFALFFSFFGTVLGGLWADNSWGRFWGWDPKENGALIIVIWNALVLHALWDGIVKDRGLALLAVAGNITTTWSWFGVNALGAGLHSYGFTDGVTLAIAVVVAIQFTIIGIGLLPTRNWRSFRSPEPPVAEMIG